jgi:hypothetical protein
MESTQAKQSFVYGNVFGIITILLGLVVTISVMAGSDWGLFLLGFYVMILGFVIIYVMSTIQNAYTNLQKILINKPTASASPAPKFTPPPKPQPKPETILPMPSAQHDPYYYSDTNVEDLPPYMY